MNNISLKKQILLLFAFLVALLNMIYFITSIQIIKTNILNMKKDEVIWLENYSKALLDDLKLSKIIALERKIQNLFKSKKYSLIELSYDMEKISFKSDIKTRSTLSSLYNFWGRTMSIEIRDQNRTIWGYFNIELSESYFDLFIKNTLKIFLLIFIGSNLISIGIANFISEKMASPIIEIVKKLKGEKVDIDTGNEIKILGKAINDYIKIEKEQKEVEVIARLAQERIEVSRQVSHDIKSPLAALDVISSSAAELQEDNRIILKSAITRIKDIANNLSYDKEKDQNKSNTISKELISSLLESIISEKRTQYRNLKNLKINYDISSENYGLFSKLNRVEFKRIISNLINNSVDALKRESGIIDVILYGNDSSVIIKISDNGPGIPAEISSKLFDHGFSYGKGHLEDSGSGLGLYHAKQTMEKWNGNIYIYSKVGIGTTITLKLIKETHSNWFVPCLELKRSICILDDDESIHQIWRSRFNEYNLTIFHENDPSELLKNELSYDLYLIDYEYLEHSINGLDVIEKLKISNRSFLVTSHFEDEQIKNRCNNLGVRIIPKGLAGFIPITPLNFSLC